MRIPLGHLECLMSEKFLDHRQVTSHHHQLRSKNVAKVVEPEILDASLLQC
ncbi:MAG: hypothetical protein WC081_00460 [Candidatus Ratteibacteria bacterium]